ncbi:hypothetical protein RJ639_000575, partial [Escallonia herrerae]
MEVSSVLLFFLFSLLSLLFQHGHCSTVVVDGVSEWKNPTVQAGDSVIPANCTSVNDFGLTSMLSVFEHKYHYNLYIFQNRGAFDLCNFTQATLLTKPNSASFTWHPSRPGFFYFSFSNGSAKACQDGKKLAVKVSLSPPENLAPTPEVATMAAPPPSFGGSIVSSSPAYPWPFRPREMTSSSPGPAPSSTFPASSPSIVPDNKGTGSGGGGSGDNIPFINSNPAVPLPTGEVDSATIRPIPTSSAK